MKHRSLFLLCLLLGLSNNISYAEDILQAPVPTLDKLHSENDVIPDTNPPVVYPDSAYSITQGTEDDYNFTTQAYDSSGNLTTQYYKIELKSDSLNSQNIKWYEVSAADNDTISVSLPNNDIRYLKYIYTQMPDDIELSPVDSLNADISNGVFINNENILINNYEDGTSYSINADFIQNKIITDGTTNDGLINNAAQIENITGNFIKNNKINNYNTEIINNTGEINSIIGNFIANSEILENTGVINNINGNFIGNIQRNIYNDGSITNIRGSFIGNYIPITGGSSFYSNGLGSVIANNGFIDEISGNFIGNYANSNMARAEGGAIYNTGTINKIIGNFIGNYTQCSAGSVFNATSYGGAIANNIPGQSVNDLGIKEIINSSFYNNHAFTTNASEAYGGAIYTNSDLSIIADSGISVFHGNYIHNQFGIEDNAIYVDKISSYLYPTLTLKSINDGKIYMYDNIDGANYNYINNDSTFSVHITGDNSGYLYLYNDIKNGNVITDNITINSIDQESHTYNFHRLSSDKSTNYEIDVDLSKNIITSDIFNVGAESSGVITISKINYIGDLKDWSAQILKSYDNSIQLAIADNINREIQQTVSKQDIVTPYVQWNQKFNIYEQTNLINTQLTLSTTSTINDTLNFTILNIQEGDKNIIDTLGDTLALLNQFQTEEDRHFNFDTAQDKYNVTEDLWQTSAGTLNINGAAENENRSEINLNGNSGFELANNSTLNINNTKLTGNETLINVSNPDAVVNLQNSHIDGNISSSTEYGLNISGNQNDTTVINGNAGRANTTLSGSNLEFNSDTFKDASLNTRSGTVNFQNENISDYNIGKLTSSSTTNYKFDIDLSGETASADKLIVGNGSSGIVTVSAIDFINGAVPDKEFIVQLIDSDSNAIQLALNSEISGQNIELGAVSQTVYDTITPTVKWNDVFNYYSQKGINYGNIGLATTETTNDSLALTVTNTVWEDKTYQGFMGDTLALVNQLETKEDRNFNFETSEDVYEVSSDLGATSKGTLNINGVSSETGRSTLNANSLALFVLDNETKLNLNNVKITNANNVVSGTNKDAVVNINNSEISNNTNGITTAGSVNISGNSVIENNGNGINVTSDTSVITLTGGIDDEITLRDRLTGVAGAKLNINGGTINFEKKVSALDVMMEQANVNMASDDLFNGNNMTVNSASNLNMTNNTVGTMHLNNLTLNDNLNMSVDVDLANKSMDRLTADSYNLGDNNVNVSNMNLLTSTDRYKTDILFADEGLRNNVTTSISEVAYSPIYKYNVAYEKDTGNFTFTRPGVTPPTPDNPNPEGGNNYDSYNPAVMASPVSSQLGGYMAMLDTYNNAFTHMDMYMLKPSTIRLAEQKANRYALTETLGVEYNSNEMNSKGMWYRPYASYDSVGLKNGPKVDNFSYGSFIGGDTEMFKTKHGFYGVVSPYVAYQGAHQSYSGNSIYQNGGTLGATATFYKGNFFTGLTAGVGMNISEASTMYGNENFPMLMAGIANKTGYNFEFKDGRYIVQPNLMLSYTFVNAFDYTNGAGVKINSDPLHALQIAPNVRFIMNTKNGWQPYAAFGMHWNIMDETNVTANTTSLPELSIKPYFSYGLGIQRVYKDRFTAYAQIMLRNGGRNGIAASFGGRYMLGKESDSEKQQNSL